MSGIKPIDQQVGVGKPITITARICAVKAEVGPVAKRGWNDHGKYHHATTDDVYHEIRPLLAKHGLDLRVSIVARDMVEHTKYDRGQEKKAYRLDYEFGLRFEAVDGAVESVTDRRFLSLPYTGPQTDETAMSYAGKQYLRQRFQLETGDFESEDALEDGNANGAAAHRATSRAVESTPEGRRLSVQIDNALPHLSPDQVRDIQAARAAVSGIGELNALATRVVKMATNGAADPPAAPPVNGNGNGNGRAAAKPRQPVKVREGAWWLGVAQKIGEDSEGNPQYGAILPPTAGIPPINAPVKVSMHNRPGRMRQVITEILDQTDEGVTVATRTMTKQEEARVSAPAEGAAAE